MDRELFTRLQRGSEALCGNNVLLPVAYVVAAAGHTDGITAANVAKSLHGWTPPNRIGPALLRLAQFGALVQLPYGGPPAPKYFEREHEHPLWPFALALDQRVGTKPAL